jgi:hypothetical protein
VGMTIKLSLDMLDYYYYYFIFIEFQQGQIPFFFAGGTHFKHQSELSWFFPVMSRECRIIYKQDNVLTYNLAHSRDSCCHGKVTVCCLSTVVAQNM